MRTRPAGSHDGHWSFSNTSSIFNIEKGKFNVVADALSRQPLEALCQLKEDTTTCAWLQCRCQQVKEEPEKYPDYALQEGALYRHLGLKPEDEEYIPWKLCVGKPLRQRVLQECHDAPTAGHIGIRKTITRVEQWYYWPGMFRDVARYVRSCVQCQKYKVEQRKPPGKMPRKAQEPFDIL